MVERIQRIMITIVLTTGLILNTIGISWRFYLNWFVVIMIALWAITGYCPFIALLKTLGIPSKIDMRVKYTNDKFIHTPRTLKY